MQKRMHKVAAYLLSSVLLLVAMEIKAAISHDAALNWQTLQSAHFRIHFHDGLLEQAKTVANIAEEVHHRLVGYFSWSPAQKTDIVLMDEIDFANGYATPHPANRIVLWLSPPEDGLMDYGPWLETLITHEYVHILHLDKVSGFPQVLRKIFGRHPLLFPAIFQPNWLIEGLATYIETDKAHGTGRGQSRFFDMQMRVETLNGIKPLKQINQPIPTWPGGHAAYLYGVEFYKFLHDRYGEEKIKLLIQRYSDNLLPAFINTTMTQVYGKNLTTLWHEFSEALNAKYTKQRDSIARDGLVEGVRLTQDGYCTGKARMTSKGDIIFVRCDGKTQPGLYIKSAQDARQATRLFEVFGVVNFDINAEDVVVIAQAERVNNANIFYDLYLYDIKDKSLKQITQSKRYRHATWRADGQRIAAVGFERGQYFIDILDKQGVLLENIWRGKQGEVISHLDWSPQRDELAAAVWRDGTGWNLELFSIANGAWTALTEDGAIKLHPSYAPDGSYLVFSADYDGVYNLYQLNIQERRIEKLSNVLTGAFSPIKTISGDLIYAGYHSQGYDIYRLAVSDLAVEEVKPEPGVSYIKQERSEVAAAKATLSPYTPAKALIPTWWSPILIMDEHTTLVGAYTSGSDPLMRHNYVASLGYDSESSRGFGGASYGYDRWLPILSFTYHRDLSRATNDDGSLLKVRETEFAQAAMDIPFVKLSKQWVVHMAAVSEDEHDGYLSAAAMPEEADHDRLMGYGVSYDSNRHYALSVSASDGRAVSLKYEDSDAFNSDYEGQTRTLDWREFIGLGGEHVLALRVLAGEGDIGSKVYQLGGNASQDYFPLVASSIGMVFDQRKYPLRGYPDGYGPLTGYNVRLYSAEWRFPISRIERGWMAPPLSLDQFSGLIFYDAGNVWINDESKAPYRAGMGVELYMDSYLLYRIPFRLRLGYAEGQDEGGESQVYLRFGTSF